MFPDNQQPEEKIHPEDTPGIIVLGWDREAPRFAKGQFVCSLLWWTEKMPRTWDDPRTKEREGRSIAEVKRFFN